MSTVTHVVEEAITVEDLIAELQQHDPQSYVLFACDYGDRGHTDQALPVSVVHDLPERGETLATTGYSQSGICVDKIESEHHDRTDREKYDEHPIVILR